MHTLVREALDHAGLFVQCDAEREPTLEGLRRALLESPPSVSDMAQLGALLQMSLRLSQAVQDSQVRALHWARDAAQKVDPSRRPHATLRASLTDELAMFLDSEDLAPMIWPNPGSLNTLAVLRADEFVARTVAEAPDTHWTVEQAMYQACGVLSTALAQLLAALRTVIDVHVLDWPVYRREGRTVQLQLSSRHTRAGLYLRQIAATAHSEAAAARLALQAAVARVGLTDLAQWIGLHASAGGDVEALLGLVRSHGQGRATSEQLAALLAAHTRCFTTEATAADAEAATQELRALSRLGQARS